MSKSDSAKKLFGVWKAQIDADSELRSFEKARKRIYSIHNLMTEEEQFERLINVFKKAKVSSNHICKRCIVTQYRFRSSQRLIYPLYCVGLIKIMLWGVY